ncbi:MAG: hypothetical protein V3T86_04825 [Planctomycetota bacterium]
MLLARPLFAFFLVGCLVTNADDRADAPAETPAASTAKPDAIGIALDAMRIQRSDLGYRPKAHWARYPHPKTVPYVLPFFEDLLANPLDTYVFTRTLASVVEDQLTPEKLAEMPTADKRHETLFKLGVALGTDRRIGGFRGYSSNLNPRPEKTEPLLSALLTLRERSGDPIVRGGGTFGGLYEDAEDPLAALREDVGKIPEALRLPLARYVLNVIDAREWIDTGLRRVTEKQKRSVYKTLATLAEDNTDGTRYYPVIDDVARVIDEHSLHYGCLKAMQATHDARRELAAAWPERAAHEPFEFRLTSPWGTVRISGGTPADARSEANPLLLVVLGHRGLWSGPVGATSPDRPLSVALFLKNGGDIGQAETADVQKDGETSALASGVLGCGVLYSSGDAKNAYRSGRWGLGAAVFGMGVLLDEGGDDTYRLATGGMGGAFFGAGLLLDAAGDDRYELLEGDGQGFGGPGGIGVLADRSGNDHYYVEPDASKAGRADYHSKKKIAANNAQGAGFGRRGDGSDGHVWAGGLGALLDVDGNDTYKAGNFSQGIGYWYGTGLLWDGGGDDEYRSVYFTQGSGAHFAVGALIDEGGNDKHVLFENAGAAFGFGWDVVNAFLIDRGAGNDRYEAQIISTGLAEVRSNAFFLDEGGDDTYVLNVKSKGFGDVDQRADYKKPRRSSTYSFLMPQAAIFLDLGGKDRYLRRDKDGKLAPDEHAKDGATWNLRTRDPDAQNGFNVSFGGDLEGATLRFLDPWPARK